MIVVIIGSMFSGKTRELINRYNKNIYIRGKKSLLISSSYCKEIKTHDGEECGEGRKIQTCTKLFESNIENGVDIFIDEGQFFEDIFTFCQKYSQRSHNITISCITTDFTFSPYENIGKLLCIADKIVKLKSICEKCKIANGIVNHRKIVDNTPILIGDKSLYEPLCFNCWKNCQIGYAGVTN